MADRFLNARASRRAGALLVAAAVLAACGGPHRAVLAQPSRPASVVVEVDSARAGRTVPRSFLGLSIESDSVGAYAGPRGTLRVALIARGPVRARLATRRQGCADVWLATVRGRRSARVCPRRAASRSTCPRTRSPW